MLIGALTAGNLTDRLGRRVMLVSSVILFSVGSAICAVAPGFGLRPGAEVELLNDVTE
jgi:AAHS family benzoate transporter-like MFS transporter